MSIEEIGAAAGFVEADFVTIEEAAEMLGLHRSQARAILGEPDHTWLSAAGRVQYIFRISRVLEIKNARAEKLKKKLEQVGLKSCGHCHEKFAKKELCDGICCACQARKVVRHFAYNGDFLRKEIDLKRLDLLIDAVRNMLNQVKQEIENKL